MDSNDIKRALGQQLQTLRRRRGLSQEQVAALIGIDTKSVSRFERGAHFPGLDTIAKLCEVLGVTLVDVFAFDDRPAIEALRSRLLRRIEAAGMDELLRLGAAIDGVRGEDREHAD